MYSNLSCDMLNHELPSLSPVSIRHFLGKIALLSRELLPILTYQRCLGLDLTSAFENEKVPSTILRHQYDIQILRDSILNTSSK